MTIKELRTEKKLSQTAFAESIGVSASTIGDIERGRTKVSPKVAEAVKNVYGVEVELGETAAAEAAEKAKAKADAAAKPAKEKTEKKAAAPKKTAKTADGTKKKAAPKTPEVTTAPAPAVTDEVEEESDDTELVAVITAAIYAYEAENGGEVPADGLVVRSIRRLGYAR
jgi:transcriptional regulator with XRE-family HTH domain